MNFFYRVQLQKFNPYHGKDGKFSSAEDAGAAASLDAIPNGTHDTKAAYVAVMNAIKGRVPAKEYATHEALIHDAVVKALALQPGYDSKTKAMMVMNAMKGKFGGYGTPSKAIRNAMEFKVSYKGGNKTYKAIHEALQTAETSAQSTATETNPAYTAPPEPPKSNDEVIDEEFKAKDIPNPPPAAANPDDELTEVQYFPPLPEPAKPVEAAPAAPVVEKPKGNLMDLSGKKPDEKMAMITVDAIKAKGIILSPLSQMPKLQTAIKDKYLDATDGKDFEALMDKATAAMWSSGTLSSDQKSDLDHFDWIGLHDKMAKALLGNDVYSDMTPTSSAVHTPPASAKPDVPTPADPSITTTQGVPYKPENAKLQDALSTAMQIHMPGAMDGQLYKDLQAVTQGSFKQFKTPAAFSDNIVQAMSALGYHYSLPKIKDLPWDLIYTAGQKGVPAPTGASFPKATKLPGLSTKALDEEIHNQLNNNKGQFDKKSMQGQGNKAQTLVGDAAAQAYLDHDGSVDDFKDKMLANVKAATTAYGSTQVGNFFDFNALHKATSDGEVQTKMAHPRGVAYDKDYAPPVLPIKGNETLASEMLAAQPAGLAKMKQAVAVAIKNHGVNFGSDDHGAILRAINGNIDSATDAADLAKKVDASLADDSYAKESAGTFQTKDWNAIYKGGKGESAAPKPEPVKPAAPPSPAATGFNSDSMNAAIEAAAQASTHAYMTNKIPNMKEIAAKAITGAKDFAEFKRNLDLGLPNYWSAQGVAKIQSMPWGDIYQKAKGVAPAAPEPAKAAEPAYASTGDKLHDYLMGVMSNNGFTPKDKLVAINSVKVALKAGHDAGLDLSQTADHIKEHLDSYEAQFPGAVNTAKLKALPWANMAPELAKTYATEQLAGSGVKFSTASMVGGEKTPAPALSTPAATPTTSSLDDFVKPHLDAALKTLVWQQGSIAAKKLGEGLKAGVGAASAPVFKATVLNEMTKQLLPYMVDNASAQLDWKGLHEALNGTPSTGAPPAPAAAKPGDHNTVVQSEISSAPFSKIKEWATKQAVKNAISSSMSSAYSATNLKVKIKGELKAKGFKLGPKLNNALNHMDWSKIYDTGKAMAASGGASPAPVTPVAPAKPAKLLSDVISETNSNLGWNEGGKKSTDLVVAAMTHAGSPDVTTFKNNVISTMTTNAGMNGYNVNHVNNLADKANWNDLYASAKYANANPTAPKTVAPPPAPKLGYGDTSKDGTYAGYTRYDQGGNGHSDIAEVMNQRTLTDEEREALTNYKGSGYDDLNAQLRSGKALDSHILRNASKLQHACNAGTVPANTMLYRGMPDYRTLGFSNVEDMIKEGKGWHDNGFLSCTTARSIGDHWQLGETDTDHSVLFELKITEPAKGVHIAKVQGGGDNSEKEIVLQSQSLWKVVGFRKGSPGDQKKWVITLEKT